MTMWPGLRKFALSVHLTSSVGWIGAVVAYLALGIAATTSQNVQTVRAAWTAMDVTGWYVIVPMAVASLVTGLVMALGTKWGLFRHYWVLFSFVLTSFATAVLLLHMPAVSVMADIAQEAEAATLETLGGDLAHPGIGLVILLVIQVLNVYKPPGMTRYGWRRQEERRRQQQDQRVVSQRSGAEEALAPASLQPSLPDVAEDDDRSWQVAWRILHYPDRPTLQRTPPHRRCSDSHLTEQTELVQPIIDTESARNGAQSTQGLSGQG